MKGSTKLVLGITITALVWLSVLYPDVMGTLGIGLLKIIGGMYLITNGLGMTGIFSKNREDMKNSDGEIELHVWLLAPIASVITFILDKADKHL